MIDLKSKVISSSSIRLCLITWLLKHLVLAGLPYTQSTIAYAEPTLMAQEYLYTLAQVIENCEWRLVEVNTESGEPPRLLPLALFRKHGHFRKLFIQNSLSPLKIDFRAQQLVFSPNSFSQARLKPKLTARVFTYALCEFPKPSLENSKFPKNLSLTKLSQHQSALLKEGILASSHPFTAYLNGKLITGVNDHKNTSFKLELLKLSNALQTEFSPIRSHQLLLRFYPYRSPIIWGLISKPALLNTLNQSTKLQEVIKSKIETEAKKQTQVEVKKNQTVSNQKHMDIEEVNSQQLEKLINKLASPQSSTVKQFQQLAYWPVQAWALSQADAPNNNHLPHAYKIQSIHHFYLPYSMLSDDPRLPSSPQHLKTRLAKLKTFLELNNQSKLESVGFKHFFRTLKYQLDQHGIHFKLKQSFHWTRPLWSLAWYSQKRKQVDPSYQSTFIMVEGNTNKLGHWVENDLQNSTQNAQTEVWYNSSLNASKNSLKASQSLIWSVFKDDSELLQMYEPLHKELIPKRTTTEAKINKSDFTSKYITNLSKLKPIETIADLESYLQSSNDLNTVNAYYRDRPSGLLWKKEKIPTQKQSLFKWAIWLNEQVQVKFIDYPSPVYTNHPLSAEYKLRQQLLNQTSTEALPSIKQAVLWSPASPSILPNAMPLRYWGIRQVANHTQNKPTVKALNQLILPNGSQYLSLANGLHHSTKRQTKPWRSQKASLAINLSLDPYTHDKLWLNLQIKPMLSLREFNDLFHLPSSMNLSLPIQWLDQENSIDAALADQVLNDLAFSPQLQYAYSTWWPKYTWSMTQINPNQDEQAEQFVKHWRQGLKKTANKLRVSWKGQSLTITQQIKKDDDFIPLVNLSPFNSSSTSTGKNLIIDRTIKMDSSLFDRLCRPNPLFNLDLNSVLTLRSGQRLYYNHQWLPSKSKVLNSLQYTELRTQLRLQFQKPAYHQSAQSPKQAHQEAQLGMLRELENSLCDPSLRSIRDTQAQR